MYYETTSCDHGYYYNVKNNSITCVWKVLIILPLRLIGIDNQFFMKN